MRSAKELASRRAVRCCGLAVFVVSLLTAVLAETRAQPGPDEGAAVLTADLMLANAMRGGDKSAARRLLSLQFTFTDEDGNTHARKDFLADLKGMAAATASDPKVSISGQLAAVTGERKSAQGKNAFFLDIWAKQKGAWRALTMQNVVPAEAAALSAAEPRSGDDKTAECKNPCQTMPYRVRSPAEQEVVNSFLALEKARIAYDAEEWSKHIGDGFVLYRSGYVPISKAAAIAEIEHQKENGSAVTVGEIQTARLWVYGDAAAMIATEVAPDRSRPPYRAARMWVRRNGQWLMTISVQTDIQTP
ncbi:MAG TPA: nuclear transport factor 2 family protein [Xanthobacteraceae bacterium]|nr:nuclear transport factor 2 family protein [Xanthobacteraceae bacterium]